MQADISVVLASLGHPRWSVEDAATGLPRSPGLYAAHADKRTWEELGLGEPPDDRPLYVGKSERSVLAREIGTHLSNGRTGSSTLRRSVAALLRTRLRLRGVPRNREDPDEFDRYGLSEEDDRKLTNWMTTRVSLAGWAAPDGTDLHKIELDVIGALKPPLNLQGVTTKWTAAVKAARKLMANEAREWKPTS